MDLKVDSYSMVSVLRSNLSNTIFAHETVTARIQNAHLLL